MVVGGVSRTSPVTLYGFNDTISVDLSGDHLENKIQSPILIQSGKCLTWYRYNHLILCATMDENVTDRNESNYESKLIQYHIYKAMVCNIHVYKQNKY